MNRDEAVAVVRGYFGDEVAALVADGWTVDSAIGHVQGTCDVTVCTHPAHVEPVSE